MTTDRCQLTVAFGSGEKGKMYASLIEKLCKRLNMGETELMRAAVLTLNKISKEDVVRPE